MKDHSVISNAEYKDLLDKSMIIYRSKLKADYLPELFLQTDRFCTPIFSYCQTYIQLQRDIAEFNRRSKQFDRYSHKVIEEHEKRQRELELELKEANERADKLIRRAQLLKGKLQK